MYIITCWLPVSFLLLLLFFPISFYHIITCMVGHCCSAPKSYFTSRSFLYSLSSYIKHNVYIIPKGMVRRKKKKKPCGDLLRIFLTALCDLPFIGDWLLFTVYPTIEFHALISAISPLCELIRHKKRRS